jgi:NAD(P)H-flavin reductase
MIMDKENCPGGDFLPSNLRSAQCLFTGVSGNISINDEIFRLDFFWNGNVPRSGQFFMIKPKRSSVFLGRPISVAAWENGVVSFLIARRGKGTAELADLRIGEVAELTGPLGNVWADFIPAGPGEFFFDKEKSLDKEKSGGEKTKIALVSGGIGIAPLSAFAAELTGTVPFDFYAGFRNAFKTNEEAEAFLGSAFRHAKKIIAAFEDGGSGGAAPGSLLHFTHKIAKNPQIQLALGVHQGRIPNFLQAEGYASVFACGPEQMLRAVAALCKTARTPCFVSMERRMACGVGACLGCTVPTRQGNKRCCTDGPIFPAEEIFFDGQ